MLLPPYITIFTYSQQKIDDIFVNKLQGEVFEQNIDVVFEYLI